MRRETHTGERSRDNGGMQANWREFKGKVKQQWGKLTDDELDQIDGRRDQLVAKVQKAYGLDETQAEAEVDSFMDANRAYLDRGRDPNMPH